MKNNDIMGLIKKLSDKIKADGDEQFKKNGLTFSQALVIRLIGHTPEKEMTQKNLELKLGVSHPTIVGIVSRLEKNGFVSCRVDSSNKRNKIVSLEPKCEELKNCMLKARQKMMSKMTDCLSKEEQQLLLEMLSRIYESL